MIILRHHSTVIAKLLLIFQFFVSIIDNKVKYHLKMLKFPTEITTKLTKALHLFKAKSIKLESPCMYKDVNCCIIVIVR